MAKIAIVTGATGGLGQEFIKEIQKINFHTRSLCKLVTL